MPAVKADYSHQTGPLFVVSGGSGTSGEQLARTALAQFSDPSVEVVVVSGLRSAEQVKSTVAEARKRRGSILHTLVDGRLRDVLVAEAHSQNVVAIDLIGRLLSHLAHVTGQEPLGLPGLYRQLRVDYFKRVEAIEFAVAHDDGKRSDELGLAEIILIGPSRVGKTPLSIYLSVSGWRVANIPLLRELGPPSELLTIGRERVIGLTIDPLQLLAHRQRRQKRLGAPGKSAYADPLDIQHEIHSAEQFYRRHRIPSVDVTEKPIEEVGDEVIAMIQKRGSAG